jgi:hypothetical protein
VSNIGAITLGDVAKRTEVLNVACTRCERAGCYQMKTLIAQHGRWFGVPRLLKLLSKDCPKRESVSAYDLCGMPGSAAIVPAPVRDGEHGLERGAVELEGRHRRCCSDGLCLPLALALSEEAPKRQWVCSSMIFCGEF